MKQRVKAFLSYSHDDRDLAARIAEGLRTAGVEAWFDQWEILPGDSLIQKIFAEGLSGADAFIVLITPNSISSRWVQQELDVAMVRRIEGVTRIIPIIIGDTRVPEPLRSLLWIKLEKDFDSGLRQIVKAIFQVYERPPIGQPPEFIQKALQSVGGLSRIATSMGLFLINSGNYELGNEENFTAKHLSEKLGLSPEETDDAIDELEKLGLVEAMNYLGTAPYSHGRVEPTYALFLHFRDAGLQYDPEQDIKMIASAVAAEKQLNGDRLRTLTNLSPLRINRAVVYLKDYGFIQVTQTIGTAPYDFYEVVATGATRRFVAEHSK
jgi:hypothetical protein